mgnify:CR=1 FL=1
MSEFAWQRGKEYKEIIYETLDGIAKITINRPERRNAFTPLTAVELYNAFTEAFEYLGRSASHSCDPEAGHRDGEWLLHRWWQRAQHALRPNDRS